MYASRTSSTATPLDGSMTCPWWSRCDCHAATPRREARKTWRAMAAESGPLSRTTPIAPSPGAVAIAAIVSSSRNPVMLRQSLADAGTQDDFVPRPSSFALGLIARAVVDGPALPGEGGNAGSHRLKEMHHRWVAPDGTEGAMHVDPVIQAHVDWPVQPASGRAITPLNLREAVLKPPQAAQEPGVRLRVVVD